MVMIGDDAPNFTGTDVLTGNPYELHDHLGKTIVLAFVGWT
jgi:alkyl hydroperoxide reductase subunit AhpC